jgi:hypothetical protein
MGTLQEKLNTELEDHNNRLFQDNQDELIEIFDKALASDGGEYWIMSDTIIDGLSNHGYMLVKIDVN